MLADSWSMPPDVRTRDPGTVISARLTGFVSFLRHNGFALGLEDTTLFLGAAARFGVLEPMPLRWAAQALLCRRAADQTRLGELFDAWFRPPNRRQYVGSRSASGGRRSPADPTAGGAEAGADTPFTMAGDDSTGGPAAGDGAAAQGGASPQASLSQTDFRHLHQPREMVELDRLMRRFSLRLRKLLLRREMRGGRLRLDLSGVLRASVRHGGEPIELAFRKRRRVRPRLILLLDVSRSMSLYSFFHLRMARALAGALLDVHVFVWHTQLTRVSEALQDPDPWRAQERLQLLSAGWAGGTRIGECLRQFELEHSRLLTSRSGLLIVSDGYDTGEVCALSETLRRLRARTRRVIWMNPLAGRPGYQPTARGMQAALPHVHRLVPGHDLETVQRGLLEVARALR